MYKGCRWLCLLLSAFLALPPGAWAQGPQSIRILVLAGQDAINNVEPRTVTPPVVEVQDEAGSPVAGAEVVFTTPAVGPSATFYGATRTTTVTTDAQGRATVSGMMPNTDLGSFEIAITATHGSLQAETVITQTNALAGPLAKKKSRFGWRLIAALGAAAVIGVIAGVRRGGDNDGTPSNPAATTFGSVSVATPR